MSNRRTLKGEPLVPSSANYRGGKGEERDKPVTARVIGGTTKGTSRKSSRSARHRSGDKQAHVAEFRRRAIDLMLANLDEVVAAQLKALQDNLPEYRAMATDQERDDLRRTAETFTISVLSALAEGRRLTREEIAAAKNVGVRRAGQGMSFRVLSSGAGIAMETGWAYLAAIVGDVPDPHRVGSIAVSRMGGDFIGLMQEVHLALEVGYRDGRGPTPNETKTVELFTKLLTGPLDDREIASLVATSGLDDSTPWGMILITSSGDGDQSWEYQGAQALKKAVHKVVEVSTGEVGLGRILIAPKSAWSEATKAVNKCVKDLPIVALLVSPVAPRNLFGEFRIVCDLAHWCRSSRPNKTLKTEDLLLTWVLEDTRMRSQRFQEHVLSRILEEKDHGKLIKVLASWLNDELQPSAWKRLRLSERTFRRYLSRARELAGVDGTGATSAMKFRLNLAIKLWQTD